MCRFPFPFFSFFLFFFFIFFFIIFFFFLEEWGDDSLLPVSRFLVTGKCIIIAGMLL